MISYSRFRRLLLILFLSVAFAFSGFVAISMLPPISSRALSLYTYLRSPPTIKENFDYEALSSEVKNAIEDDLSPSIASRIVFQRVESWSPLHLDSPQLISDAVDRVADTTPILGSNWIGSGQIIDNYRSFLGELQRDVIVREWKKGSASSVALPEPPSIFEIIGRRIFATLRLGVNPKMLSAALQDLDYASIPDPTRPDSRYPKATLSPNDIQSWLDGPDENSSRRAIAKVRLINEEHRQQVGNGKISGMDIVEPIKGEVSATLYSRDWRLFEIRRSYKPEELLESFRTNVNPYINVTPYFGVGGSLTLIPYGIVVAKDIAYKIDFGSPEDFHLVSEQIRAGKPLTLALGSTSIILEPGTASIREGTSTISIAPAATRAEIVGIVSVLY